MTDLKMFNYFNKTEFPHLVATAIECIGTPNFPPVIAEICERLSGYDSLMIYAFIDGSVPELLFNDLSAAEIKQCWNPYLQGAYLLDPFYRLYRSGAEDGVYHLKDIAPDDFYESEYFMSFYQATHLSDETTIISRCNFGTQIHLSLGARNKTVALSEENLQQLILVSPILIALCRRHWPDVKPGVTEGTGRMGAHLEGAFQRFGSSCLSNRECEIVRLVLQGHSSKSIARVLGISPETVKVYRKRVHSKLGINSQSELFSMFLEGLRKTPVGVNSDPLEFTREN